MEFTYPYYWQTLNTSEHEILLSLQKLSQAAITQAVELGFHLLEANIATKSGQPLPGEIIRLMSEIQDYPLSFHEVPVEVRDKQVGVFIGWSSHNTNIAIMHAAKVPIALKGLKNLQPSKQLRGYNIRTNTWVENFSTL